MSNVAFALVSVVTVSLVSLVGLLTISMDEARVRRLATFFVSFAVGALTREENYLMYTETRFKLRQLTIGDLVVAVTDAALEVTQDEDKAYEIASLVLMKLLEPSASKTAEHLLAACDDTLIH